MHESVLRDALCRFVGGPAEMLGLRAALGTVAVAGALIFTLSLRLAVGDRPSAVGEDEAES